MKSVKIGFAPTRRSIFSAPDAVKYRGLTADRLRELGIDFVDIDDINDEGLVSIYGTDAANTEACKHEIEILTRGCFTMRRIVRKSRRNSAVRT